MEMIFNTDEVYEIIKSHLIEKMNINEKAINDVYHEINNNDIILVVDISTEKGRPHPYR